MRLAARRYGYPWLEEGMVVEGHTIERIADGPAGSDARYLVRSPEGKLRTLVISQGPFADRRERSRWRALAAARAVLEHPAAIRVHVVSQFANRPLQLLRSDAPLAPERVIGLLGPVAEALDVAGEAGLVHHALSPDSLLLYDRDELALDDLGLVQSGEGIEAYRSPEELWGHEPTGASNVYSLTAVIVEALTGALPYEGDRAATLYRHVADAPPSVSDRVSSLGREIDSVVARGLAKDPTARPHSATGLIAAAADALGVPRRGPARPLSARPPLSVVPNRPAAALAPPKRRSAGTVGTAVGAAVICGALAGLVIAPFGEDGSSAAPRPVAAHVWKQLASKRSELRDRLAAASTPTAQADAASALGTLYQGAARTGQPRALAAAARAAATGYEQLAAAAGGNDDAAYAEAVSAVEQAEARFPLASSPH
jgi:hypothetical protein